MVDLGRLVTQALPQMQKLKLFYFHTQRGKNYFMNTSDYKTNSYLLSRLILAVAIVLFSGCASVPEKAAQLKPVSHQSPIITYALSLQGVPYRYGKDSPEEGFDCSGFVKHVYEKQGIKLPRTVKEMALTLPQIPKNAVHSGDLLFFNTNGNTFSHVGIYVNNDKFVHAPSKRTGRVLVSTLKNHYWKKHYIGARRPRGLYARIYSNSHLFESR